MPAHFRQELRRIYLAPFLAMAMLAGVVLWLIEVQQSSSAWVELTDLVIRSAKDAEILLHEMAIAIKSYWISSDKEYLIKFANVDHRLTADLATLSALVGDNPAQGRRVLDVSNIKGTWIGTVQALIAEHGAKVSAAQLEQLNSRLQDGSNVLDQIVDQEDQLLRRRASHDHLGEGLIFVVVLVISGGAAALLAFLGWREIGRATERFADAVAKEVEASRAKDYFLATVSHELRNPLNSIMLLAGVLLSDSALDDGSRRRVEAIDRAARTQAQLINDLLDVSRVESGRMRLDVQATDLAAL